MYKNKIHRRVKELKNIFQIETAKQNHIITDVSILLSTESKPTVYGAFILYMMNMANTALILINFQSAWRDQSSDYYLEHFESLIPQAQKLLDHARDMQYKIIFIKHIDPHGPFSEKDENSEIIPELIPQDWELVISKRNISSYYQTFLADELEGIENLIICGVPTNLCVRMAVEESYDRGFRIALIADICAAFSDEAQEFTLEDLYNTRSGLAVLSLEQFMQ